MKLKKALSLILIVTMIFAVGCTPDYSKDIKEIESIPETFLDALKSDDIDAIEDVVKNYDDSTNLGAFRSEDNKKYSIVMRTISRTEIVDTGDVQLSEDKESATLKITLSYIDLYDIYFYAETTYMTLDEYLEQIDSFKETSEAKITLKFVKEDDSWLLTKHSALSIVRLFTEKTHFITEPVDIGRNEAEELAIQSLTDLSLYADSSLLNDFSIDDYRVYDNILERDSGNEAMEAYANFIKAYMTYVLNHPYSINHVSYDPNSLTLVGNAPSSTELYQQFNSKSFLDEYYMCRFRYSFLRLSEEEYWKEITILIYNTLAEAIPNARSESYELEVRVSYFESDSPVTINSDLINKPDSAFFEFDHGQTSEQVIDGYTNALESLLASGEISEEEYEEILPLITPEMLGYETTDASLSPEGHENQAIGVYEDVPEFSDGTLVYGYSSTDSNGFWMFYSKNPEWLDTVGYYLDRTGVWVTCYFEHEFDTGTELLVDWWIDGDPAIYGDVITIEEDGTTAIEVYLPLSYFPDDREYEVRVWEDNHTHVLAYVVLTNSRAC